MSKTTVKRMDTGEEIEASVSEVAPGIFATTELAPEEVPRFGIVRMLRQPDGRYIPVLTGYGQMMRMGDQFVRKCGIEGLSTRTLYRLIAAGFVRCRRPAPNVIFVDLVSLVEHLEKTEDPEFWNAENLRRYRQAEKNLTR